MGGPEKRKLNNQGNEEFDMLKDIQAQISTNRDSIGAINVNIAHIEEKQTAVMGDTAWIKTHILHAIDRKVDWRVFILILALTISLMGFGYSVYADDDSKQSTDIEKIQSDVNTLQLDVNGLKTGQENIIYKFDQIYPDLKEREANDI